jgi:hypothetical protein
VIDRERDREIQRKRYREKKVQKERDIIRKEHGQKDHSLREQGQRVPIKQATILLFQTSLTLSRRIDRILDAMA